MYARKDIERIFLNLNSLTLRATLQHIERVMESEIAKVQ